MKNMSLSILALVSGTLLAVMISFNSTLGLMTTPMFSSLFVHLMGFIASYVIWLIIVRKGIFPVNKQAPLYGHLAGCIGGFIVVMSNVTVQSPIGLAGTVALSILGQITFSLICDLGGYFGLEKRSVNKFDIAQMTLVIFGTMIILFG